VSVSGGVQMWSARGLDSVLEHWLDAGKPDLDFVVGDMMHM